jgi:putative hydrolase of the HAD superfamily
MKNGQIKTIFFDVADTLFYIREGLGNTYAGVARKHGADDPDPDQIKKAFSKAFGSAPPLAFGDATGEERKYLEKDYWRAIVEEVYSEVGMFEDFDAHFDELFEVFRSEAWALFPESDEILSALKDAGFKLGIISNFDSRVYDVMKELSIDKYFDFFIISSEAGYAKPQAEIFHIALNRAGVTPSECLHVGDNLNNDFHSPRALGIKALLLDREGGNETIGEAHRIKNLFEIHKHL